MTIRHPAVAGHFYPGEPEALRRELDRCLAHPQKKKKRVIGIVVPHAGYHYSGAVAGEVYAQIEIPDRLIILSPNHTGEGAVYSLMREGAWETPLGVADIDSDLTSRLMKNSPLLKDDAEAHRSEHSLEVQIPFLQSLKKKFSFAPLTLGYIPYERCQEIGQALSRVIHETEDPVLIIASSDLNHYEDQATTQEKDLLAIRRIEALDPRGLYETVRKERISMCGIIPTTAMLVAARELGAQKAELIRHATSGDVTGDFKAVVGYAGLIVS